MSEITLGDWELRNSSGTDYISFYSMDMEMEIMRQSESGEVEVVSGPLTAPDIRANNSMTLPDGKESASKHWVTNEATIDADTVGGNAASELGVPSNVIAMWSGAAGSVPAGWTLCDGTDGAPDLRNRFIVGAGNSYSAGDTGGQATVQLSVDEMPSHTHTYSESVDASSEDGPDGSPYGYSRQENQETSSAGGDQAHENRPPYYALAFIMKK